MTMVWKDNHIRHKACDTKTRYATFNEAMKRAKRIEQKDGVKVYPYECRFCGGWHLSKELWEDK